MDSKKDLLSEAIDAAIRTNRMEKLELSTDAAGMVERIRREEISLQEFKKAAIVKYTTYSKGKTISYEEALSIVRRNSDNE